jgi:hypothetical protein
MEELPAAIEAGLALMVTVGEPEVTAETVTVEFAVADPPGPVAVAV